VTAALQNSASEKKKVAIIYSINQQNIQKTWQTYKNSDLKTREKLRNFTTCKTGKIRKIVSRKLLQQCDKTMRGYLHNIISSESIENSLLL
jgi:hypothetical protein